MSEQAQRQELHSKIWKIADDVRGAVDGWDFKQYILGILFYRFISENFKNFIESDDPNVDYANTPESVITDEIKDDAVKTKGYFIMPSQLFSNVVKNARNNDNLNTDLKSIFDDIQASAIGYESENDIKGLFDDVDTTSNRLGNTVPEKNKRLADILEGIAGLNFGNFEDNKIDLFGDAYEYLISNYASNAGKSGGEFFTPQNVSKLLAKIVMLGRSETNKINKIYDPACGFRVIIMTQANSQVNTRVLELLPKFKIKKMNSWCAV
ncbi:type I restriction-modification system M protein [Streptococcus sp. NCTC 11567]|nr:type I restriction-modification system M protein [Streptococcus sp. NCTC 11567]